LCHKHSVGSLVRWRNGIAVFLYIF